MIKKTELLAALDRIAPLASAEAWDNCGMQLDLGAEYAERILVCLEITKAVIAEAREKSADFIVTHHPLYFSGTKQIDNNNFIGNYTIELIRAGVSVYSAHTCFDKAPEGNNVFLCRLLGLSEIAPLRTGPGPNDFVAYTGRFAEAVTLAEAARRTAEALRLAPGSLRYAGDPAQKIGKVCVCTGAGAEFLAPATENGCELLITGDVKYHEAAAAQEDGAALIDAGHFGTEKIFAENMAALLAREIGGAAEILLSEAEADPFTYLL